MNIQDGTKGATEMEEATKTTDSWWKRFAAIHHEIVDELLRESRGQMKREYFIPFVGYVLYLWEADALPPLIPILLVQGVYLYGVIVGIEALVTTII